MHIWTKICFFFAKNEATQNQFNIHKLTRNGLNNLISHWVSHSSKKFSLFVALSKKSFLHHLLDVLCCFKLISYFLLFIIFLLFFNKLYSSSNNENKSITLHHLLMGYHLLGLLFFRFLKKIFVLKMIFFSFHLLVTLPALPALAIVILSEESATSVWISFRLLFRFIFLSFFPSLDFSHLCITNGQEHIKITSLIFEKIRTL